jgi:hypothetical protein
MMRPCSGLWLLAAGLVRTRPGRSVVARAERGSAWASSLSSVVFQRVVAWHTGSPYPTPEERASWDSRMT